MRFLISIVSFLAPLAAGSGGASFLFPLPQGAYSDSSLNPVFTVGSNVNVQWTLKNESIRFSVCMYQVNGASNLENLDQNIINTTSFTWTVGTLKDLTVSTEFFMAIFFEGDFTPEGQSATFNITAKEVTTSSSSRVSSMTTSSSATLSATTSSTYSTTSPTGSASGSSGSTNLPVTVLNNSGLSTGAKVGLGVGIPIAVFLGVIAGWLIFKKPWKKNGSKPVYWQPGDQDYQHTQQYAPQYTPEISQPSEVARHYTLPSAALSELSSKSGRQVHEIGD